MDVEFDEFMNLPVQAVPVVFCQIVTFEDSDLQYTLDNPRTLRERFNDTGTTVPEQIDLTKVKPAVKNYQYALPE